MHSIKLPVTLEQIKVDFLIEGGVRSALAGLQLTVFPGEWLAVVGRNGSGKSTLAKVIAGLCPVSGGQLVSQGTRSTKVRMILQQPEAQIVGETVYEDICFGMENEGVDPGIMRDKAVWALSKVGMADRINQPVGELSGGQKQLLAVAASLAVDADLLVFDEATSMLDPTSRAQVLKAAAELHLQGTAIVWITQWMEELAWASRVAALNEGRLFFEGSREEFFYTASSPYYPSACDLLGFEPPYAVKVGRALLEQGEKLPLLPVTVEDLGGVVNSNEPCRP